MKINGRNMTALILVLCMLIMTGCYKYEADVTINTDGTASYAANIDIDKTAYVNMCKKNGISQKEINDSLKEYEKAGYQTVIAGKKEYLRMTSETKCKKGELKESFYQYDDNAYADAKTVYFKVCLKDNVQVAEALAEIDYYGYKVKDDFITVTYCFEFPHEIVRTTGKKDMAHPNKVTFTINLGKSKTVFATTDDKVTLESFKAPGKVKILSLKANRSNKAVVKLKKVKYASGYDIHYSAKKGYRNAVKKSTSKTSFVTGKLKKNQRYYFRIRAKRKLYTGHTVYGAWSTKTVVTNK